MESKKDSNIEDVGSIRWADGSEPSTSTPSNKSRITIRREVELDAPSLSPVTRGSFSMDVNAFEKSLQEKRDRQLREQSPRIEIRLRETSTASPRDFASSSSKIDIHHIERESGAQGASVDEVDCSSPAPRKIKRIITYEKVLKTKSIRETTYPRIVSENVQSPVVQRTVDCLVDKSSSTERITPTEDSAYHSHRVRLTSSGNGTPTTISISSSSDSIQHVFTSDENVYAQRTPSRERIFLERAGSEPPPPHLIGIENRKNRSSVDSTIKQQRQVVSPVTDSNENVHRHFESYRTSSESEGISSDWYNEYQTQTVQVDRPHKMDFKRSNSQYDNHIRQIRGTFFSRITQFYIHSTIIIIFFIEMCKEISKSTTKYNVKRKRDKEEQRKRDYNGNYILRPIRPFDYSK